MTLLARPGPRVFTAPPAARFLDALAAQLWDIADGDPLTLADIQVFLPTRRAARALAEALRAAGPDPGGALIAPAIRPLGDLDADEPPFEPGGPALEAPPEVDPARRLFELTALVRRWIAAEGRQADAAGALAAAREIAAVIDEIETAEIPDLAGFDADLRARLPEHLQHAAAFLDILQQHWPARLAELGATDVAARRAALLRTLAAQWRDSPPQGPVIAAGSTGTVPAAAALLKVIARLPQGAVVLPGLDPDLSDAAWEAADHQHPQFQIKRLLGRMGVARGDVAVLPGAEEPARLRPRRRLIAQALLPAERSGGMLEGARAIAEAQGRSPADFARAALGTLDGDGLSLIEARTEEEEALACALAIRQALDPAEGTERVMLVTPDAALAARVSARLTRWDIEAESSAGAPLSETAPGAFLVLLAQLAAEPTATLNLCALWKHPLCALGRTRPDLRRVAAAVERRYLRGVRPADLRRAITDDSDLPELARSRFLGMVEDTEAALAPLTALDGEHGAPERARALAEAAEAFARTPEQSGAARAWAGEGGEAAARLTADLIEAGDALPPLDAHGFSRLLAETMAGRVVRPRGGEHPRLRILGPLEARLQSADLVILAGLNEGTWPTARAGEPFLSREMRTGIGLDPPERRIGQAAHDFAQLAGAPRVILSRSQRADGSPAVASRFLWRLKTLAAGALDCGVERAIPAHPALGWARALDRVGAREARPVCPPAPRPPVDARPRSASATELRLWVRDPYSVFAKRILKLKKLDPVDAAPGAAERGTAIHDALAGCFAALAERGAGALEELTARGEAALGESGLAPEQLAFAVPRLRRAMEWLAEEQARRTEQGWVPAAGEQAAVWALDGPAGPFEVRARADRLDLRGAASAIIDYKTGGAPSLDEIKAGFDLQMPVQAAMARAGAFEALPAGAPESLVYLKLGGGRVAGEAAELAGRGKEPWSGADFADLAERVLGRLIVFFDNPDNPYLSQPRAKFTNDWGEYDHLARRGEWARAAGTEEA